MAKRFERSDHSDYERELLDKAARLLPASARTPTMSLKAAMIVREGRGSKLIDMSGNEYIDYLLGSGPMFLGHAHPRIGRSSCVFAQRPSMSVMSIPYGDRRRVSVPKDSASASRPRPFGGRQASRARSGIIPGILAEPPLETVLEPGPIQNQRRAEEGVARS
jgi:hypothetical protein